MRMILILFLVSMMSILSGCQSAASSTDGVKTDSDKKIEKTVENAKSEIKADDYREHGGEAPRISLADAKKDFDNGKAIFIDTRSEAAFNNERIKGALNLPASDFEKAYKKIPKNKKIIAYCS